MIQIISRAAALGALIAHCLWRWPAQPGLIVRDRNDIWSVPNLAYRGPGLAPSTRFTTWWVELRFGASGRPRILLCRDQLSAERWRELQAVLRREVGGSGLS